MSSGLWLLRKQKEKSRADLCLLKITKVNSRWRYCLSCFIVRVDTIPNTVGHNFLGKNSRLCIPAELVHSVSDFSPRAHSALNQFEGFVYMMDASRKRAKDVIKFHLSENWRMFPKWEALCGWIQEGRSEPSHAKQACCL